MGLIFKSELNGGSSLIEWFLVSLKCWLYEEQGIWYKVFEQSDSLKTSGCFFALIKFAS